MDESAALDTTARAVETADRDRVLWSDADREWASRAAASVVGERASAEEFLGPVFALVASLFVYLWLLVLVLVLGRSVAGPVRALLIRGASVRAPRWLGGLAALTTRVPAGAPRHRPPAVVTCPPRVGSRQWAVSLDSTYARTVNC